MKIDRTSKAYRAQLSDARATLKTYGVNTLLADPVSNPKVAKNAKVRVLTAPMHLAPHSVSGFNVCPMATQGCIKACLHTAGNPAYMAGKQRARINKTRAYFEARAAFMFVLQHEIAAMEAKARKARMRCGIRLNATSDIVWERMPVTVQGRMFPNVMSLFPRVQFYDYTKRANRTNLPANYHLTFSLADGNDDYALIALRNGQNVAAVFNVKRGKPLPASFAIRGSATYGEMNATVIDGDEHDYRPADPSGNFHGVIVGLRAKGKAIGDQSGFVRAVA